MRKLDVHALAVVSGTFRIEDVMHFEASRTLITQWALRTY